MRLAQAATANMRGEKFIRSSPALAVVLGDADSYRRLFADRSGWRGARSARLTVAHRFADDTEEARIQCESTVRWINWHIAQPRDETHRDRAGQGSPTTRRCYSSMSRKANLALWYVTSLAGMITFSLSASDELLQLLELFDQVNGTTVLADFVSFAASNQCTCAGAQAAAPFAPPLSR